MAATVATGTTSTSQTRPVWFKGYFSHAISIISLLFTMQILKFFLKKHYCCILLHLVYLMVNLKACLTRKYSNLTHSNTRSHTWGTQRVESSERVTLKLARHRDLCIGVKTANLFCFCPRLKAKRPRILYYFASDQDKTDISQQIGAVRSKLSDDVSKELLSHYEASLETKLLLATHL